MACSICSQAVVDEPSCCLGHVINPCCLALLEASISSDASSTDGGVACSFSAAFSECLKFSSAGGANGGC